MAESIITGPSLYLIASDTRVVFEIMSTTQLALFRDSGSVMPNGGRSCFSLIFCPSTVDVGMSLLTLYYTVPH